MKAPVKKTSSAKRKAPKARIFLPSRQAGGVAEPALTWARHTSTPHLLSGRRNVKKDGIQDASLQTQALRLFFAIADVWGLNVAQRLTLLGKPESSASTYHHWKRAITEGKNIPENPDLLDRIAYIVGIFEAAGRFWGSPDHAKSWLTQSNSSPVFQGKPPLARMLEGRMEDLRQTCMYIESAAEGAW